MSASMGFVMAPIYKPHMLWIVDWYFWLIITPLSNANTKSNFLRGWWRGSWSGSRLLSYPKNYISKVMRPLVMAASTTGLRIFTLQVSSTILDANFWRLGLQSSASHKIDVLSLVCHAAYQSNGSTIFKVRKIRHTSMMVKGCVQTTPIIL